MEDCDVEKDITGFIKEQGTGQEIPDPPKFINFCRGDINDAASEVSADENYSVAQFQRTINPAFRSSSPQPSTYESHHDPNPNSTLAQDMGMSGRRTSEEPSSARSHMPSNPLRTSQNQPPAPENPYDDLPTVPHNEYPMEGMTQFCRLGPPSERSSIPSPTRPDSRDATSEYSNPTSFSSFEPSSGHQSPVKNFNESTISSASDDREVQKKRSGFFNNSPFRRKSKTEKDQPQSASVTPSTRNIWAPAGRNSATNSSPTRPFGRESRNVGFGNGDYAIAQDADPVDPRANFQLNVGNNVFDVASPDNRKHTSPQKKAGAPAPELDPIAQALAELKGVAKQASVRVSADRYHGISTPGPSGTNVSSERTPVGSASRFQGAELRSSHSGTPPPLYDAQPVSRLGAPQPAFTSKQMQQTTASYTAQKRDMFSPGSRQGTYEQRSHSSQGSRPGTRDGRPVDLPRTTSPAPLRSTSPRPFTGGDNRSQPQFRSPSPNPYGGPGGNGAPGGRPRAQTNSPTKPQNGFGNQPAYGSSPGQMPRSRSPQPGYGGPPPGQGQMPRARSPQPGYNGPPPSGQGQMPRARSPQPGYGGPMQGSGRPPSSRGSDNGGGGGGMALQLAQGGDPRGRGSFNGNARPTSAMYGDGGPYSAAVAIPGGAPAGASRNRSQSSVGGGGRGGQVTKDGRPILHFGKSPEPPYDTFTTLGLSVPGWPEEVPSWE